jgi:two-component system sensor histidine kinase GlrK
VWAGQQLLSNAIKSSVGGAIKLTVTQSPTAVWVDVIDSGPGIETADKDRVFEPFFRSAVARDSRIKGTGLGLSIVKEYVLAHGGSVEAVGADNGGGHFRVTLPRTLDHAAVG